MATSLSLTCQYEPCGKAFDAPRRRKYCEPLCERRAYSKKRLADGRHKAYRDANKVQRAAYMAEHKERYTIERECLVCGTPWRTHRKDAKYCSDGCKAAAYRGCSTGHMRSRRASAQRRLTLAARGTSGGVWVMGRCVRCDEAFVCRARGSRSAQYCGRECYTKDKAATRRARMRAVERETVRRVRVFERDAWTCHLCSKPLDREASFPHPLYPTIDHVVPLAKQGPHTMANLRAAHFMCNSVKSDRDDLSAVA